MRRFVLSCCLSLSLIALASAEVTLSDGTVVQDNQLADQAVLLEGNVTWYENGDGVPGCIDLDPLTYSFLDGDNSLAGQGQRSILEFTWSNCTVKNGPGFDLMTGEVGSNEGSMISLNVTGSGWTGYYWVQPQVDVIYTDETHHYSVYDFSNIGVAEGAVITAVRFSNTLPGPTVGLYRTFDDFGNPINGTLGAGQGYKLSATDADPRYIAALNIGGAAIPGDANNDGMVDVGDLGILAGNYGMQSGATWAQGDFNNDGAVDVGDLGILAGNYGTGSVTPAAVPEPLTLSILGLGGLALIRRK